MNSLLYCTITGTEQEHVFLYKNPEDNYGKIYINLLGTDGKYYQISGKASKNILMGNTEQLFYDFVASGIQGRDFGNFLTESTDIFIVNKFTGYIKDFFYNSEIQAPFDSNIQPCHFGTNTMKKLPEPYSPSESAILVGIGIFLMLCLYIFLRKYFLELWKKFVKRK